MSTTPSQQPLYEVGVEDLFIAMMVGGKDTSIAIPTYDALEHYPIIETIGIQGNQTTATKWASNKLFANVVKNSTYTLTLDHPALPVALADQLMGYIADKGIVFDTSNPKEYPYFAVGFIAPLSDGVSKIARWYPKVQLVPAQESYTTGTEETTIPTKQLTMTASPLAFNNVTKVDFNSARDSATGITAEKFMAQVICDESQLTLLDSSAITVSVTPKTASVAPNGTEQLTATITGATNTSVDWSSSDANSATVSNTGLVTVDAAATAGTTVTITATSAEDTTVKDTCVLTVS